MIGKKIRNFTDLQAWKEAHKLTLSIYQVTKLFPNEETYSLVNQMRRSSISISSNIAEGFSRQSRKEKIQFYYTAKGSLTELQNQLLISKDIHYISHENYSSIIELTIIVDKLLTGLIRSIRILL